MNYGPLIFLAAFLALAGSWFGLVLKPQMQIGQLQQTNTMGVPVTYPVARPGLATQGLEVYRANGCAYCHSQQVRQSGTVCDVLLQDPGTNQAALMTALLKLTPQVNKSEPKEILAGLPKAILQGVTKQQADAGLSALTAAGAKAELWVQPVGPDISRGWGKRRTVAEDFLFDSPVLLGSQRIGPDLANVGARQPDANWQLRHLYAPQVEVKGSTMPPFRFLFEKRKIERVRSPEALELPAELAPPAGFEIVPKREAKMLAAYLLSLRADAPIFPTPMSVPAEPAAAGTNAPGTNAPATTGTTNAAPTNAPSK
jgi:cbb3-type cytochrome oxidase cytochrome c subunit